jgi:DNA-binding SARP family transcriptional activator
VLEVRLLGQFDVRLDGAQIAIPSRAAQSLLAYLILGSGTMHRREKLSGLLWPDTAEENARKNLRNELWRLRKALEPQSPRKKFAPFLIVDEISIGFEAKSDYWLDVSNVQAPIANRLADDLAKVISHYRGELLPGIRRLDIARARTRAPFAQKMERLLELLTEEKSGKTCWIGASDGLLWDKHPSLPIAL